MRILTAAEIESRSIPVERVVEIAERTLVALHEGKADITPRQVLPAENQTRFMALPAILHGEGIAGVKWLGIGPFDPAAGRQALGASILLSRTTDCEVFAMLDAGWITAVRTAAVSLVAAKRMARPDSGSMAMIACGAQARLHFDLFHKAFPLRSLSCFSRRAQSAEILAERAHAAGLAASVHASMRECVEGADIVVTTSPVRTETVIEPDWLKPGAFVSLVDLGRTIATSHVSSRQVLVVDDAEQFHRLMKQGSLGDFGPAEILSLPALVAEHFRLPLDKRPRLFLPTGLGAVDIAIAWEIAKEGD